jgi:hypothetical protein
MKLLKSFVKENTFHIAHQEPKLKLTGGEYPIRFLKVRNEREVIMLLLALSSLIKKVRSLFPPFFHLAAKFSMVRQKEFSTLTVFLK